MALRLDEWRLKMSEGVTATLAKLTNASDKTAAKFTRLQDRIGKSLQSGQATLSAGWKGLVKDAGDYKTRLIESLPLPGNMASGLAAMSGPLIGAIALLGGLTLGLMKGVQAAEQFGIGFRPLRNLNLDKSKAELDGLKASILGISFKEGLDPSKISEGYFDIQSAVGLYGAEAEKVLTRIGNFSRATNADFNTGVKAVAKSMIAFKMGGDQLDDILISNAKAVQTGIVAFDTLAQVQTEYATAAGSAGQTIDTANKLFVALTKATKEPTIAANMLKTAFQDIGKEDTIAGFKKIGVEVYDANGAMRQTDAIMKDLVPVFAQMSDQTFGAMKEEIGGSEGLRALLDIAKASGDDFLKTLESFDATKFSVDDVIKMANADIDVMKDKISNKLTAAWTILGEKVLPAWVAILTGMTAVVDQAVNFINVLQGAVAWMKDLYNNSLLVRLAMQGIMAAATVLYIGFKTVIENIMLMIMTPIKALGHLLKGEFSEALKVATQGGAQIVENLVGGAMDMGSAVSDGFQTAFNPKLNAVPVELEPVMPPSYVERNAAPKEGTPQALNVGNVGAGMLFGSEPVRAEPKAMREPPYPQAINPAKALLGTPVQEKANEPLPATAPSYVTKMAPPEAMQPPKVVVNVEAAQPESAKVSDPYAKMFAPKEEKKEHGASVSQGVSEVVGGGKQVRNVNVRIESLVKQLTIQTTNVKESAVELKRVVEEQLIRAVQGGELAIAND